MRTLVLLALFSALLVSAATGATIDNDWWKKTIVYQIYPRSFQDSNGDGVGDLKGIQSRLDYFSFLNVEAIWLSPIFLSPMADFGYDVADYVDIDPVFGTLQDFDDLLAAVHAKGMKLIMDFIPNHSSDQHKWFQESRKGGADNPYASYYCWTEGILLEDGTRAPPNNWISIFTGSAWEWDDQRQAYYLHQFVKEQPDLNYRNPAVREEMEGVLKFWIERGVDGFRVDAIQTLFEVEDLSLNEPPSGDETALPHQHESLKHPYTLDQPEIHEVIREWRNMMDEYEEQTGKHIFMVMEAYSKDVEQSMKYYHSGSDMPFNFHLIEMEADCGGRCVHDLVDSWMKEMPTGHWPNFVLGNHDRKRVAARKGEIHANALNILLLTLPGTPTTYYGEEIVLPEISVSYDDTQDPWGINMGPERYAEFSRDPCRAPMQWTSGLNAGFSSAEKTWLPVHPDFKTHNVEAQRKDLSGKSSLHIYRKAAALRKLPSFQNSDITYHVIDDNIFSYIRHAPGEAAFLVAMNLGNDVTTVDLTGELDEFLFDDGEVFLNTGEISNEALAVGKDLELKAVTLEAGEGFIVRIDQDLELDEDNDDDDSDHDDNEHDEF